MQVVILAGGFGTRISEESSIRPKPMVEIGGKPILWHIMKIYSSHGINDFIICCGYKGHVIKNFFNEYGLSNSDVTFDLRTNRMEIHRNEAEPWNVTLVETGLNTMTGGRIKRVEKYLKATPSCAPTVTASATSISPAPLHFTRSTAGRRRSPRFSLRAGSGCSA
jgi:glucose-1-phosphate cytidylyltransferase